MKRILLIIAIAIGVTTASAQDATIFENPSNRAFLGARVGVDISSTGNSGTGVYNNGTGFTFGGVYNIPVYKNLYFEPGLSLFYNTFGQQKLEAKEIEVDDQIESLYYLVDSSIRNLGFRIPFIFGYNFDFTDDIRVAPFTGPQMNLSLLARYHRKSVLDPETDHSLFGENGFKHTDFQWVFGVGVTYQQYYASISGGIGLNRCYSKGPEYFRRNTFNISLGYNF